MNFLFDLTAIYDHLTGIERYSINISRNIIKNHPENNYTLIFKNEIHESFKDLCDQKNVEVVILKSCQKFLFIQWRLMRCLYKKKADKYIFLAFTSPWLFRRKGIINTIHDISAWDCPGTRKWYLVWLSRIGIRNAVKVSERIITVSNFSKKRIMEKLNVDENRISVIYNGISSNFLNFDRSLKKKVEEKYSLPSKYLLCLSTLEPRKNMKLLIDSYLELKEQNKIDYSLVLAGRKGWKIKDVLGDEKKLLDNNVVLTGFIDDQDLPLIYYGAIAFVFPSLYEGFGIPVIEAMACGTIVISSDSSSLPEVIGNAGLLFKNNSKQDLEDEILKLNSMTDEEKDLIRKKAFQHAKDFSWEVEAEKLNNLLKKE